MPKSTTPLVELLAALTQEARAEGWSDAEWARRSGLPKETLCRLRSRSSCDLATLDALSRSLGRKLTIGAASESRSLAQHMLWPASVDRRLEAKLVALVRSNSNRLEDWWPLGPPFFLAGLACMVASVPDFDRPRYLDLAEALYPGATEQRVFSEWLAETPLPPSRFLPMLHAEMDRAA